MIMVILCRGVHQFVGSRTSDCEYRSVTCPERQAAADLGETLSLKSAFTRRLPHARAARERGDAG